MSGLREAESCFFQTFCHISIFVYDLLVIFLNCNFLLFVSVFGYDSSAGMVSSHLCGEGAVSSWSQSGAWKYSCMIKGVVFVK